MIQETLIVPPRTAMAVFKMMPEGTLAEVIENQFYMSPAPNPFHQRLSMRLSSYIFTFVEEHGLGEVFHAPTDLFLDQHSNAVQPDIFFFSPKSNVLVDVEGVHGSPDLIIEILSPGNKNHDLKTKKDLYEKFGVREYWVIDPESKMAKGFELKQNEFQSLGSFKGQVKSTLLKTVFRF
jgi:Uma2 family endonuclease